MIFPFYYFPWNTIIIIATLKIEWAEVARPFSGCLTVITLTLSAALLCWCSLHFIDEDTAVKSVCEICQRSYGCKVEGQAVILLLPEHIYFALQVTPGPWFQYAEKSMLFMCLLWTRPSIEPNAVNHVIEIEVVIAYQIFHVFPSFPTLPCTLRPGDS